MLLSSSGGGSSCSSSSSSSYNMLCVYEVYMPYIQFWCVFHSFTCKQCYTVHTHTQFVHISCWRTVNTITKATTSNNTDAFVYAVWSWCILRYCVSAMNLRGYFVALHKRLRKTIYFYVPQIFLCMIMILPTQPATRPVMWTTKTYCKFLRNEKALNTKKLI